MELPAVQFNFEMARDKENTANVLYRMKKKSAKWFDILSMCVCVCVCVCMHVCMYVCIMYFLLTLFNRMFHYKWQHYMLEIAYI